MTPTFSQEFFSGGKSILRQRSFTGLIFIFFSDQILGGWRQKSLRGGANCFKGGVQLYAQAEKQAYMHTDYGTDDEIEIQNELKQLLYSCNSILFNSFCF